MNKLVTKLLSQSLTQQEFNNLLPNKINELGLKTALELIHIQYSQHQSIPLKFQ